MIGDGGVASRHPRASEGGEGDGRQQVVVLDMAAASASLGEAAAGRPPLHDHTTSVAEGDNHPLLGRLVGPAKPPRHQLPTGFTSKLSSKRRFVHS